jgi:hypothetical protein
MIVRKLRNLAEEWRIGIATGGSESTRYRPGAVFYATVDYSETRRVLRRLALRPDDTFVDVGAGKGRALCLAARYRMQRAVGMECAPHLAEIARSNAARMRGKQTPIEVHTQAAEDFDYSAATVLYLFNPFEANILDLVLNKVAADRAGKALRLAFVMESPAQKAVFVKHKWLICDDRWGDGGGLPGPCTRPRSHKRFCEPLSRVHRWSGRGGKRFPSRGKQRTAPASPIAQNQHGASQCHPRKNNSPAAAV